MYATLSTRYASSISARLRLSLLAWASQPFVRWCRNTGIAMADRMPMMMMTTRSSIRVKPASWFLSMSTSLLSSSSHVGAKKENLGTPKGRSFEDRPFDVQDGSGAGGGGNAAAGAVVVEHLRGARGGA